MYSLILPLMPEGEAMQYWVIYRERKIRKAKPFAKVTRARQWAKEQSQHKDFKLIDITQSVE